MPHDISKNENLLCIFKILNSTFIMRRNIYSSQSFATYDKNKLSSEADLLYVMHKAAKRVNETLWLMVDQQLATSVQGYRTSQPCVSGYGIHSITAQPLSTK